MAKTHAERQKAYRERKKAKLGEEWLQAESKRTKAYYTPTDSLSVTEANKRRQRIRKNVQKFRSKQQPEDSDCRQDVISSNEISSTSDFSTATPSASSKLIVKLPNCSVRKRINRTVSKQKRQMNKLKEDNLSLKRKYEALRKRMNRLSKRRITNSPRSKAENDMRKSGISPRKHPKIRKQLILSNCLTSEIDGAVKGNPNKMNIIRKIVAGKILKKYGMTKSLSVVTNIHIRSSSKLGKVIDLKQRKKTKAVHVKLRSEVKVFMEREDNSRQLPGKADAVKGDGKEKIQKFVLNDYLHNLYLKFKAENQDLKISRATFCRLRPKHVSLVNYAARATCLCTKHQNFALKLQCLKNLGVSNETSPDKFAEKTDENQMNAILSNIVQAQIVFKQWKRVQGEDGKQRTKLVECEKEKNIFIKDIMSEFIAFCEHVHRVAAQYQAFRIMKDKLKTFKNHVCVQMDFAENYGIKEMEEIQSAYWNPEMVTLHPVVLYYSNESGDIMHKSFVAVSEVLHHNSCMVLAIIKKVVAQVKSLVASAKYIHYWTDSPTSQYRNKTIFDLVACHQEIYGLKASWQYFECGHGKGACDGIGGVAKRSVDNAIKTGKATIQCGRDFFEWSSASDSKVCYMFVEREEYDIASTEVETRQCNLYPVRGTMKIHSVVGITGNKIITRETTCCCENCFTEDGFGTSEENGCKWNIHVVNKSVEDNIEQVPVDEPIVANDDRTEPMESQSNEILEGTFVAAVYENKPYIGKVVDMDETELEISFMESGSKVKNCLKWPTSEDKLWIPKTNVICTVSEPQPTGKGKRLFKLINVEDQQVENLWEKRKKMKT